MQPLIFCFDIIADTQKSLAQYHCTVGATAARPRRKFENSYFLRMQLDMMIID